MELASDKFSIIVCTYNPVESIFTNCLASITAASDTFPPHEVLLIDNNSTKPIESYPYVKLFLQSNPSARVIVEKTQGLTPARIRGLRESQGDFIIFVDDDNFIDTDYFSAAAGIFKRCPFIGAFSGQATLEYDTEPEAWTRKYWGMLIYRKLEADVWSNIIFNNDTMPNGAGLCISRDVGERYVKLYDEGKRTFKLDRSQDSLLSGGDNDLAMCACDIGKGMGLFKDLHLKHFTPARRFTLEYLSKLAYGIYFSYAILLYMRTGRIDRDTFRRRIKHLIQMTLMNRKDRVIQQSCRRGLNDAVKAIESKKVSR